MNQRWIDSSTSMSRAERVLHLAGGALLLIGAARSRTTLGRAALAAAGAGLVFCGLTRNTAAYRLLGMRPAGTLKDDTLHVVRTVMVERPPEDLYAVWRNFENLPGIMGHLESVRLLDGNRSLWRAKGPLGATVEWEAEVTHEIPDREIGWRSLPGSGVDSAGIVRFEPSPLGNGTQLQVEMVYAPPAGKLGALVARLFGEEPNQQLDEDLQRFKLRMEAATIPTVGAAAEYHATFTVLR
jgi:uncharacterized membrane protein